MAQDDDEDEDDLAQLFSNDKFYEENGIPQAKGEVPFVGDLWVLPGTADSTLGLLGVSLSNSALRFTRDDAGGWHAAYRIVAAFDPANGPAFERTWDKTVDVTSFDETLLTGETIIFQAEVRLAPGKYELDLSVVDVNADETSLATVEIDVPALGPPSVGEPVLLRRLDQARDPVSWVVHPSHTFPSPPERIPFMVVASASGGPFTARARLVDPRADEGGGVLQEWSDTLDTGSEGGLVAFGTVDNSAQFGEFRLDVDVVDGAGTTVAHSSTPLVIAGSAAWIADHWKDVLSVIRYEATEKEMDILEDLDDPSQRIEAWACFWRLRDPISTTAVNEAMQDYFDRIETANETWKSALRPGYQSDRGRAYVTLGPPDDIQSNPVPFGQNPFEIWTYQRGRQFQLLFVDRIGFNNYQLDNMATYQRELGTIERQKRAVLATRAAQCPMLAPAFE